MKKILMLMLLVLLIGCSKPEIIKEEIVEEEPVIEQEPEPDPVILLEKGVLYEHAGKEIILADVNPQITYCRIRVGDETLMISIGRERTAYGVNIKVLNASIEPNRVCKVVIT